MEDNPFRRIYRVLFWSGVAWALLSLGGSLTLLFQHGLGIWMEATWGSPFLTLLKGVGGVGLFALVSTAVGLVCAIPGVVLITVNSRDEYVPKGRRVWSGGGQGRLQSVIALALTITIHCAVLTFQVLTCPPFVRHWFAKPNFLTEASLVFTNRFLHQPFDKKSLMDFFSNHSPEGVAVFIPAPVMNRASMLPRLRNLLGAPVPYLLTPEVSQPQFEASPTPHPLTLLAAYQPQLFLILRTGALSFISKYWQWIHISEDSFYVARDFFKRGPLQKNGFQALWLRELEFIEEPAMPLSKSRQPWYWKAPLTSEEIEKQMDLLDSLIESIAQAALEASVNMFSVLPWTEKVDTALPPIRPGFVKWSAEGKKSLSLSPSLEPLLLSDVVFFNKYNQQWQRQTQSAGPCQPFWDSERGQRLSVLCRKVGGASAVFRWKSPHIIEESLMSRMILGVGPTLRDGLVQATPEGGVVPKWVANGKNKSQLQNKKKSIKKMYTPFTLEKPLEVGVEVYTLNSHKTQLVLSKDFELLKGYLQGLDAVVSQYAEKDGVWE